jgi:outer membrane protein assembly factor BamB
VRIVDEKTAKFRKNTHARRVAGAAAPRRWLSALSAAILTAVLSGCGNTDSWVTTVAAQGWPAQYADASNSSYTATAGATSLALRWTRSVKGDLGAGAALSARSWLALNAQTPGGCSLMEWENNSNGRQRWCTRLYQGGGFSSPLFDGFDNLYVGQPGAMLAFPSTQWIRWRRPVIGMPLTPRILDDGQLLVVTHLGQVVVFDAHRGTVVGSPMDLVDAVDPTDSARGLSDCASARPDCPIAAAPAFSAASGLVVIGLWEPGAKSAVLVALRYHRGQHPLLMREWTSGAVGAGVLASPVLSADGATVYVNGRDNRLWALHSADGKPKWSVNLEFLAQTPPAVLPSGLIVSGGGPDTRLVAVKDAGDHAQQDTTVVVEPGRKSCRLRRRCRRTRSGVDGAVTAGLRSCRWSHDQRLPAARGVRLSGRGVGGGRPPCAGRHQRRAGLQLCAQVSSAAGPIQGYTVSGGRALRGTRAWLAPAEGGNSSPGAK